MKQLQHEQESNKRLSSEGSCCNESEKLSRKFSGEFFKTQLINPILKGAKYLNKCFPKRHTDGQKVREK